MKSFPIEKYHFYYAKNKVIAVSTYCKKIVRGVAVCDQSDTFSKEIGERLAAARCNEKVAQKRSTRAQQKYIEACEARDKAFAPVDAMKEYMNDSFVAMNEAAQECDNLLKDINRK